MAGCRKKSRTWIKAVGIFLGLLVVGLISFGWFFNKYVIGEMISRAVVGAMFSTENPVDQSAPE